MESWRDFPWATQFLTELELESSSSVTHSKDDTSWASAGEEKKKEKWKK